MQDHAIFSVIFYQLIYLSISKESIKYCFFGVYVYISDQPIKTMIQIQMSDQTPIRSSLSKQLIFCHYVALLLANDFFWWKMIKIG